jgi:hypothetical protein
MEMSEDIGEITYVINTNFSLGGGLHEAAVAKAPGKAQSLG